tara:strand:+ start:2828 stop:3601 length:774 start_codon:yes stop_codon:yes gene_type:complete
MIKKNLVGFQETKTAGKIASNALDELSKIIKPGITTNEIDLFCYNYLNDNKAFSAPLYYRGFPKSCCTSVNHVVCHGIPSEKILREGDILNVDITAIKDGWHGDTSKMFLVGECSTKAKRLVEATYISLMKSIKILKAGINLGDIGYTIQNHVESEGFSVVKDFCGHGIGKNFHNPPNILHYGSKGSGQLLEEGMIFTIEPMINEGKFETKVLKDGWTAVTRDKSLSAQFEHTVGIKKDGYEIFTLSETDKNFLLNK